MLLQLCFILSLSWQVSSQGINMNFSSGDVDQPIIINGQIQSTFIQDVSTFDCSLRYLFTYNQSIEELVFNYPNDINVQGLTSLATFSISTKYNMIKPQLSANSCNPPGCVLQITNNCNPNVNYNNYFDIIELSITSGNYIALIKYNLYCLDTYSNNPIQFGLIIEIFIITLGISLFAFYSKAWSLQGIGIKINVPLIIIFNAILVIGGIIAYLSRQGIDICLAILSYFLGVVGVSITMNQFLSLFKSSFLRYRLFKIKSYGFRLMELWSIITGVAITVGWWYSDQNMILNDIICICAIISCIKLLKFTSLKLAGLAFMITITLELIVVLSIYFISKQNYNSLFINNFNYPVELQIPTINPVYGQKCAWLPFTSIAFPGMLLAYLRRFDTSRNTYVYIITSSILFFLGAISWYFTTLGPVALPFGLISWPCMFGLVCVFAYRRREIRVLWNGQFYDEQFANHQDLQLALQMMVVDKGRRQTIDKRLIEELKQSNQKQSQNRSNVHNDDAVRSKFLK